MEDPVKNLNAAAGPETDLASRWLGGSVLAASDESFGEKENLLNPAPAAFEPGHYGPRGEIVDGWETRRRRAPGHDWAIIRLGAPGVITSAEIDTSFFTGNHPESCLVEAGGWEGYPGPAELAASAAGWVPIAPRSALAADTRNVLPVRDRHRYTHLRLSVFPDGGVARLRACGHVVPDPRELDGLTIDLASQRHGGAVLASSDDFYTSAGLLIRPDTARSMGEGWETRRRRDGGHDFAVLRLAFGGQVSQLIVDTAHFRYNASAEIAVHAYAGPGPAPAADSAAWKPLLGRTRLQPDTRHVLAVPPPADGQPVTSIRLDAFPDGGISRLRVIGRISPAARLDAGYRWFNSLPASQAGECLSAAGLPDDLASSVPGLRPLGTGWADELRRGAGSLDSAGALGGAGPGGATLAGAIGVIAAMLAGPGRPARRKKIIPGSRTDGPSTAAQARTAIPRRRRIVRPARTGRSTDRGTPAAPDPRTRPRPAARRRRHRPRPARIPSGTPRPARRVRPPTGARSPGARPPALHRVPSGRSRLA